MYDLGIIGGMGSEATAEIFRRIVALTNASFDQEHMKICVLNKSQIPDRTDYLLNNGQNPLPLIIEGINELKSLNTRFFIIPCNTSHVFSDVLGDQEDIVFIDMVKTTKTYLRKQCREEKICILGTTGTISADVYNDEYSADRICMVYPNHLLQLKVMDIILSVKANNRTMMENRKRIIAIMKKIVEESGYCTFVVACTELSVIMADLKMDGFKIIDAMELLAIIAILEYGYIVNVKNQVSVFHQ